MANITLKQLRYFDALSQHRHFGHAAEVCSISQPALSIQIRDLEEELGAKLFERGARQVTLTGFGEEFAPRVASILNAVDELGDLARARHDRLVGRQSLLRHRRDRPGEGHENKCDGRHGSTRTGHDPCSRAGTR